MGFYGNVTNTTKTNFVFDRIYSNRTSMDNNIEKDGVFIGRYVLIEYDGTEQGIYIRAYGPDSDGWFYLVEETNKWGDSTKIKYSSTTTNNTVSIGTIIYTQNNNTKKTQYYICTGSNEEQPNFTPTDETNLYMINYNIDKNNYSNMSGRGYDSTVWTKTSIDGKVKYVNIADLNAVVPTFGLVVDAPTTVPIPPHFDTEQSNVYYKLHTQPQWGFRVAAAKEGEPSDETTQWTKIEYDIVDNNEITKYASDIDQNDGIPIWDGNEDSTLKAAIYYNKKAFLPYGDENKVITRADNTTQNKIEISLGKSGNQYNVHNGTPSIQNDTQELTINLPAIGNMMSDAWDIIHGPNRDNARTDEGGSLQGRLDSFKDINENQIPVKRSNDGTLVGTNINGNKSRIVNDITTEGLHIDDKTQDDAWIKTIINTTELTDAKNKNNNGISIHHTFHADNTDYDFSTNKNKDGVESNSNYDKIKLYSPSVDAAGHVVGGGYETVTLPYGFKTINVSNDNTENDAPIETEKAGETADNTQDVLQFSATNKWIKMQATGDNNIEFGHELSGIEAKEHGSSDINITNFGDSFNILKFTTDKAGHITSVGEDTIKIPSIIFTDDTTGNVVTNMTYNYNDSNKIGTFTEIRENIGTLALGTHTGTTTTTNGLDIVSTDTISDAFNKTQTHINNLNLNSTNSDLEWVTDVSQANGQVTIAKKGTDNLKLNNYSALTSVSTIDLASQDTLNNAFGKLEYRIKEEEKNRAAVIEGLDVSDTIDDTKYVSGVSETNGKITVSRAGTDTLKLNNYTIADTSSDIINGDTINEAFGKVQKQIKNIYGSEEIAINFNTIKEIADWLVANDSDADKIIDDIAILKGSSAISGSVAHSIKTAIEELDSEIEVENTYNYLSGIAIENGKLKAIAQGTLGSAAFTESSDYALAGSYDDRVKEEDYLKKIAELEQENYTLNSRCNVLDVEVKNLINKTNAYDIKILELENIIKTLEERIVVLESNSSNGNE